MERDGWSSSKRTIHRRRTPSWMLAHIASLSANDETSPGRVFRHVPQIARLSAMFPGPRLADAQPSSHLGECYPCTSASSIGAQRQAILNATPRRGPSYGGDCMPVEMP